MKKLILFALIITSYSLLYSQDREAQPLLFKWGYLEDPRIFEVDSFPQNNFLTGFQWTGSPKMNHSLLNNATASGHLNWEEGTNHNKKMYLIGQPIYIKTLNNTWTGYNVGIWNAQAMVYEPTLRIPKNDSAGMFITRDYDSTNAIFGFHNIKGQVLPANEYSDKNYNRLILRKGIDTGLVLNDIWPKPKFETKEGTGQLYGYQGQKWNLTINLRRKSIAEDDTLDNQLVLEVKLPYRAKKENNYYMGAIRFDSLPYQNINYAQIICSPLLNNFRGKEIKRNVSVIRDSILRIYRSMIPIDPDTMDITISAHFLTYNNFEWPSNNENPAFFGDNNSNYYKIDSLDIEVRNKGITDICIDYIKIENDEAYYLSRGAMDSLGILDYNNEYERPKVFPILTKARDTTTKFYYPSINDVLQSYISRYPTYTLN